MCVFIKLHMARAVRPCHPSNSVSLALILPLCSCLCLCERMCVYLLSCAYRAIRPCHPSRSMLLVLVLPKGIKGSMIPGTYYENLAEQRHDHARGALAVIILFSSWTGIM